MTMTASNREVYNTNPAFYMEAYAAVGARYGLRAAQRDQLDETPLYGEILHAAGESRWESCSAALFQAGILRHPAGLEPTTVTLEARDGSGFGASPCCGGPFRTHTSRCREY